MKLPALLSLLTSLDNLTVSIFPLISQILMTNENQVQVDGAKALHQISVDCFQRDDDTLPTNGVYLLLKQSDQIEKAKIAVLVLIEKFVEADFFGRKECMSFSVNSMDSFMDGAFFKIKKHMLPCTLTLSKHKDYTTFQQKVFSTRLWFARDSIWSERIVAVELMREVMKKLKPNETDRICECLDALKLVLSDESKQIKCLASQQVRGMFHEVHLHAKEPIAKKKKLNSKIAEVCDDFLDDSPIACKKLEEENVDLDYQVKTAEIMLSSGIQDELDRVLEFQAG